MNPLREYFEQNKGRLIHKWDHYFEIYHRHFERWIGASPKVLEIGVSHGGSLQMWRHYFGEGARIVGLDIDPRCAQFQDEQTRIIIGDQSDRALMQSLAAGEGPFDIIIDDGGHRMTQQIVSMKELLPAVSEHGVYLVEDIHTSYWPDFDGGLRNPASFIEYAKGLIDELNGAHLRESKYVTDFTKSVYSMTFYDSVLVLEKTNWSSPVARKTGRPSW